MYNTIINKLNNLIKGSISLSEFNKFICEQNFERFPSNIHKWLEITANPGSINLGYNYNSNEHQYKIDNENIIVLSSKWLIILINNEINIYKI